MSEPFLGQVIAVGFNFAPVGWELCAGQLLDINQNAALFQLLGTTYGGDGVSTFALPDLRGRSVMGAGQGPTVQNYVQGQLGGSEAVTLNASEIAGHSHALMAATSPASAADPGPTMVLGATPVGDEVYSSAGANATLASGAITAAPGGGTPHENRQPYTVVNYIIAMQGIFPSRN